MKNCYSLRNIENNQLDDKLIDDEDCFNLPKRSKHFFSQCMGNLEAERHNQLIRRDIYSESSSLSILSVPESYSDEQQNELSPNDLPTPLELIAKIQIEIGSRGTLEEIWSDSEEEENAALAAQNRARLPFLHEDSFQSEPEEGDPDMRFTIEKYHALQKELKELQNNK